MKLTDFNVLSFDCYGTLIDWETGMAEALQPLAVRAGKTGLSRDQVLEAHARHEAAQEAETPDMPYSQLLTRVNDRLAREWGVAPDAAESATYGQSVKNWPAFPDSAEALKYLKQHYKLVILSNVDRASFKASNVRLQVEFDYIYTAQDIGSYKPDLRNIDHMLRELAKDGDPQGEHPAHRRELVPRPPARQQGRPGQRLDPPPARQGRHRRHLPAREHAQVRLPLHQHDGDGQGPPGGAEGQGLTRPPDPAPCPAPGAPAHPGRRSFVPGRPRPVPSRRRVAFPGASPLAPGDARPPPRRCRRTAARAAGRDRAAWVGARS